MPYKREKPSYSEGLQSYGTVNSPHKTYCFMGTPYFIDDLWENSTVRLCK